MTPAFIFLSLIVAYPGIAAPMPTDEMKFILDAYAQKEGRPVQTLNVDEARNQPTISEAVKNVIEKKKIEAQEEKLAGVEDIKIQGADGKLKARIYTPEGKKPFPVIVYYHGGGWVLSDIDDYDASARSLAILTKAIVVAPEYRRAPENKFPDGHDDAFAAYQWTLKNAASIKGDPKKMAVAGEGAGGNLAINVAIMARDQSLTIPSHELLIYPIASTNMNNLSYRENIDSQPLNKKIMEWYMDKYLRGPNDRSDSRINLLKANFRGLNPATIITAEIDPLRVEGKELAEKMQGQGVEVTYRNYEGVTHEFFGMSPVLKEAQEAQKEASAKLNNSFDID